MSEKKNFFRASAEDFKKIPGSPVAYWMSGTVRNAFNGMRQLDQTAPCKQGIATANNDLFLKRWFEVSHKGIFFGIESQSDADEKSAKWLPYNKGGEYRKWYGNKEFVINWTNNGYAIRNFVDDKGKPRSAIRNENFFFLPSCTWSDISSTYFGARYSEGGTLFDGSGHSCFPAKEDVGFIITLLCSKLSTVFLKIINPTMHFQVGNVAQIPLVDPDGVKAKLTEVFNSILPIARGDWNAYETSWDFTANPLVALVNPENHVEENGGGANCGLGGRGHAGRVTLPVGDDGRNLRSVSGASDQSELISSALSKLYAVLRAQWAKDCEEMRRLETENNRIFIEAYGLQDELTPEVPWHEITLTCNPWYRYGVRSEECGVRSEELPMDPVLEERLRADTVKELISYAVGCMMGRYSLEKPGLILADQGATLEDFKRQIPDQDFEVDDDGIIPVLDNDLFADDIVTRFKDFIKKAFGESHYFQNIEWIESTLGKSIRDYFTKDFYKDHLQRYQNRPIYWMFQSPKGAFRALIYMHRYTPDMVGRVLGYLRSLQTKVENLLNVAMRIAADESQSNSERVRANKDVIKYAKAKKEIDEYEKNVLYPLSTERIEIDLDDGVKVNYRKFASALAKVKALETKGE